MEVLQRPVLKLNRNWQAIDVVSVAEALTMVWNERARLVQPEAFRLHTWDAWMGLEIPDGALSIRSAHGRFRVPEIVCLAHYDRLPSTAVTFSRRNIAKRDHYLCQYCGDQPGADDLTVDHVIPRSRGGPSTWTNCVAACVKCNSRKADRTPEQAGMKLKRPPLRPEWRPFFAGLGHRVDSWAPYLEGATRQAVH